MTDRRDLLLVLAAACLIAAGALVAVPLGVATAGVVCAAVWWLLGDAS